MTTPCTSLPEFSQLWPILLLWSRPGKLCIRFWSAKWGSSLKYYPRLLSASMKAKFFLVILQWVDIWRIDGTKQARVLIFLSLRDVNAVKHCYVHDSGGKIPCVSSLGAGSWKPTPTEPRMVTWPTGKSPDAGHAPLQLIEHNQYDSLNAWKFRIRRKSVN